MAQVMLRSRRRAHGQGTRRRIGPRCTSPLEATVAAAALIGPAEAAVDTATEASVPEPEGKRGRRRRDDSHTV